MQVVGLSIVIQEIEGIEEDSIFQGGNIAQGASLGEIFASRSKPSGDVDIL